MARPRDAGKDRAILDAARSILGEVGYPNLTMEAVARRAGVGKPTVYRRWHGPAQLAFAATVGRSVPGELPDTGNLADDVRIALHALVDADRTLDRNLVAGVLGQMIADAEFSAHVFESAIAPTLRVVSAIWQRALDRGEVDPAVDGVTALHDLSSAVHMRTLVFHEDLDADAVDAMLTRFLRGVHSPRAGNGP